MHNVIHRLRKNIVGEQKSFLTTDELESVCISISDFVPFIDFFLYIYIDYFLYLLSILAILVFNDINLCDTNKI